MARNELAPKNVMSAAFFFFHLFAVESPKALQAVY